MLQVLQVSECGELTYLWKNRFGLENLAHLQQLEISSCPQLVSLEEDKEQGHPCNLQYLRIEHCDKLEKLPNVWQYLTCLEELEIKDCLNLMSFPEMGFPPMLRRLSIQNCEALKSLPDGMMRRRNINDTNTMCLLQYLRIDNCPSLIYFPKGQLPISLKELIIWKCENLKDLPEGMMHPNPITSNMCFLEYLELFRCPSLICFPKGHLPTTLKHLHIQECERLESLPEGIMDHHSNNTVAGLQVLHIERCSSLTSFPRGKFPSTLEQLWIMYCPQLESISEEMFHCSTSLELLTIKWCPNIESLPKCLYNLRDLQIHGCENLELLPFQLQNLTSLTSLEIFDCKNLKMPLSQWGLGTLNSLKTLCIGGIFPEAASFSDDHRHRTTCFFFPELSPFFS
ncbi:putative disease resistance protein At3g14460 [Vitis riparia]|uniref:putative disease resistance protein At3g14460 n=1 Tax=Vitis riparia TaxID=96939 RepID=UPI00155A815E|nr:putative disease resistance protein At3g14460 [Vitis riparia]